MQALVYGIDINLREHLFSFKLYIFNNSSTRSVNSCIEERFLQVKLMQENFLSANITR